MPNTYQPQVAHPRTSIPPPPYSSVDPRKVPCVANNNRPANFPAPNVVPLKPYVAPQKYCVICQLAGDHETTDCQLQHRFENNIFPAGTPYQKPPPIPPRPTSSQGDDPYKWSAEKFQTQQQSALKVETKLQSKEPSKKTPSPNYDSNHNPYVWTNQEQPQQPSKQSSPEVSLVIDLNKELPSLNKKMKENTLPSFQQLHSKLKKNTSVGDIRKTMVGDKYLSDVKFIVDGSVFHAHKMIMVTASFYFYDHFHLKGESELLVANIDQETFRKIMNYCYTDKLEVTEADVLELLLAANQLQVRQVTNVCHGFISNIMSADSIFTIYEKALELNNDVFKKKCQDFIDKNEQKCFSSKGFFAMSLPSLLKILEACQYPQEKVSELVEKYTNGSMVVPVPSSDVPPNIAVAKQEAAAVKPKGVAGGAVKKQAQGKKNQPKQKPKKTNIPPLMSVPTMGQRRNSGPPPVVPFPYAPPGPPPFMQQPPMAPGILPFPYMYNSVRPFAGPPPFTQNNQPYNVVPPRVENLINFDDDDNESIISKDDEEKVKVNVCGPRQQLVTEFSRLDFVCKRSMMIHEIWFSENLAPKCKEVKVTITVLDGTNRSDIHRRTIPNNKPGMR